MRRFAHILSYLFHPLLMLTYGVTLALTCTFLTIYPLKMKGIIIGGTFLSTAIFPAVFISLLVWSGAAKDIELSRQRDRTLPYLIFIICVLSCAFFLHKMLMPVWILAMLFGTCVALVVALCVNFFWKISAHSIGIGGLTGGIMGTAKILLINPYWAFIVVILIAGALCAARIYLKRHTPMQVYTGFCLGFICTFVASSMSYIYLFI